jgi:transmembrane sensor
MDGGLVKRGQLQRPVSRATRAEAAAWIARLHSDARTSQDERALKGWLAARPEHAAAFESLTAVWDSVGEVRREPNVKPRITGFTLPRRAVLAGLGAMAFTSTGIFVWREAYAGVYETGIGEQKHVALEDGTEVFLDADSRIRVRYYRKLRTVELQRGRANFRVAPDSARPFIVHAAERQIVAEPSTFDVRREGEQVTVVLTRGHAAVAEANGAAPASLTAGERLVATPVHVEIDKPSLPRLIAWQSGQAVFENDTLEDAAREMNRYSTVALSVSDPAAARLRLSGVYRVGDNETFARSVSALLPVKIVAADGRIRLIADPHRPTG